MQTKYFALMAFLLAGGTAFAISDANTSSLMTPKPSDSKLQLELLRVMHRRDKESSSKERRRTYFYELYVDNVDVEAKLKPATVDAIRALPTVEYGSGSVLPQGALTDEVLRAIGLDPESSVFIKLAGDARVITVPVKNTPFISINWGENLKVKTIASLNLTFPAALFGCDQECARKAWGIAVIAKSNPFKDRAMTPIPWKSGDLPIPIKAASFQNLDKTLKEPGKANSNATIMTHAFEKSELALVSAKASNVMEANLYLLRSSDSTWYQLEDSVKTDSDYFDHPHPLLIGDILKDFDQVIVIGRKSGWDCGKVILLKSGQVIVQTLRCEPSSC